MAILPIDVVKYIIEFIEDIDTRRAFRIYKPISPSRYALPIGCTRIHINEPNKFCCHIPNLYEFEEREQKKVIGDFIEVRIADGEPTSETTETPLVYYIATYRFKPKALKKNTNSLELFFSKITEYYWDFRVYSYCRT